MCSVEHVACRAFRSLSVARDFFLSIAKAPSVHTAKNPPPPPPLTMSAHSLSLLVGLIIHDRGVFLVESVLLTELAGFRVALTGTALELDAKFEVVKKLKLVGYPDKIFKKTAFIKGMFNSDLEVLLSPVFRSVVGFAVDLACVVLCLFVHAGFVHMARPIVQH